MTFSEQLEKLGACKESLEWVKGKTIEQAWKTCKNPRWMIWALSQTDLDLIDPICEMAERVLHLVPEDSKLACIWAISAAKRRASKDELHAARAASDASAVFFYDDDSSYYVSRAATAAADAADAAYAASAAYSITEAAYYTCCAAAVYYATAAFMKEQKKQCDIIRKYFTITQVKKDFKKLVA